MYFCICICHICTQVLTAILKRLPGRSPSHLAESTEVGSIGECHQRISLGSVDK